MNNKIGALMHKMSQLYRIAVIVFIIIMLLPAAIYLGIVVATTYGSFKKSVSSIIQSLSGK